jgi:superfamily I DNA and RNA helicase
MNECISEFEELKNNNFLLKFIQPSDSEVKTLAHEMEKEARMIDESRKQI